MSSIKSITDLDTYCLARELALAIFVLTKKFPSEEKFSLIDQIRRSRRSIQANIAEGWGKRIYIELFKRHLVDSLGSLEETKSWLISSLDCCYITLEEFQKLSKDYDKLGRMIYKLRQNGR